MHHCPGTKNPGVSKCKGRILDIGKSNLPDLRQGRAWPKGIAAQSHGNRSVFSSLTAMTFPGGLLDLWCRPPLNKLGKMEGKRAVRIRDIVRMKALHLKEFPANHHTIEAEMPIASRIWPYSNVPSGPITNPGLMVRFGPNAGIMRPAILLHSLCAERSSHGRHV